MKPKGLLETTVLMALCNPLGYAFLDPTQNTFAIMVFSVTLIVVFSYLVLWYYWQGRNWARILVMINSGLALVNLSLFQSAPSLQRFVIAVEAPLGVYLLYWLNRRPVREFFRGAAPAAVPPDHGSPP